MGQQVKNPIPEGWPSNNNQAYSVYGADAVIQSAQ
jgi:hypothetical protein